jgi:hypothetical protein
MMIENSIRGIKILKGRLDNISIKKTAKLSPMDGLRLKTS